jgi:uridine kinase
MNQKHELNTSHSSDPMREYLLTDDIQQTNLATFDFDHLVTCLKAADDGNIRLIHVSGVSAAGKTTLSRLIAETLPDTQKLSIDSYLIEGLAVKAPTFGHSPLDPARPHIRRLPTAYWEMDLVKDHLERLKHGETVDVPIFDETLKDRAGYASFAPSQHVVFEGWFSFDESLCPYADYRVLVTAPFHDRLVRKIVRAHCLYKLDNLDDIGRYLTTDEPTWRHCQDEFISQADQIFHNPADPVRDYATMPEARYARKDGKFHRLVPLPEFGMLTEGEEFGVITRQSGHEYQLCYAINGRQLVNLPLPEEFFVLLLPYYQLESR